MTIQLGLVARQAEANATAGLLNSGLLRIYTGAMPNADAPASGTMLVELTLANPAFAAASDDGDAATAVANTFSAALAVADGDAGYFRMYQSDGTTMVYQGTITAIEGGGDIEVNSVTLVVGQTVSPISVSYSQTRVNA